jgi:hypothetical protein
MGDRLPLQTVGDNQIRLSRVDCIGNQKFERSGSIWIAKYKVPDVSLALIALPEEVPHPHIGSQGHDCWQQGDDGGPAAQYESGMLLAGVGNVRPYH